MKVAIAGCTGRMGLTLVSAVHVHDATQLVAGSERPGTDEGAIRDMLARAGATDLPVVFSAAELVAMSDAVIDFTSPESSLAIAEAAANKGSVHIVGTTGFSPQQAEALKAHAKKARVVWSANYSLGVNVLDALIEKAAALLSDDYDIEVDEMHHKFKKDAPSGTALMLAKAAARGRGVDFDDARVHYGEGMIGERERGSIGMSVKRGGDVVGVHTVTFAGPGENLELTHRGFSRDIYAHGAIKAALWAKSAKPGLYTMRDVLGL